MLNSLMVKKTPPACSPYFVKNFFLWTVLRFCVHETSRLDRYRWELSRDYRGTQFFLCTGLNGDRKESVLAEISLQLVACWSSQVLKDNGVFWILLHPDGFWGRIEVMKWWTRDLIFVKKTEVCQWKTPILAQGRAYSERRARTFSISTNRFAKLENHIANLQMHACTLRNDPTTSQETAFTNAVFLFIVMFRGLNIRLRDKFWSHIDVGVVSDKLRGYISAFLWLHDFFQRHFGLLVSSWTVRVCCCRCGVRHSGCGHKSCPLAWSSM